MFDLRNLTCGCCSKMVYAVRPESENRMLNFFVARRYIFSYIKRTVWGLSSEVTRNW